MGGCPRRSRWVTILRRGARRWHCRRQKKKKKKKKKKKELPKQLLTPQEYLPKRRVADFKSRFSRRNVPWPERVNILTSKIILCILGNQLLGGPCEVYSSELRLKVSPTGLYTYPDLGHKAEAQQEVLDIMGQARADRAVRQCWRPWCVM